MAKRVLSRHQKIYLAGFRKGLRVALAESRQLMREEITGLVKELVEARADFQALAMRYHQVMIERAAEEAQHEREQHPGQLLH